MRVYLANNTSKFFRLLMLNNFDQTDIFIGRKCSI